MFSFWDVGIFGDGSSRLILWEEKLKLISDDLSWVVVFWGSRWFWVSLDRSV